MKKIFKVFLFLMVFLGFFLIAMAVVFKIFVTPERVKSYLEQVASQKLNRSVVLGPIHVGLQDGISVKNIRLSERLKKEDLFFSVDELKIQLHWLPLLSKKISVKEVALVHPTLYVVKLNAKGEYNFSDLTASSSEPSSSLPSAELSKPLLFLISHIRVALGNIHYIDLENPKNSAELKDLNLNINGFSLDFPMTLDADFDLIARGFQLNNKGQIKLNLFSKDLFFPKWTISGKEIKATITGDIKSFLEKPQLGLRFNLEEFDLDLLGKLGVPVSSMKMKGLLSGQSDVVGALDQLSLKGNLVLDQVSLEAPEKFIKPALVPSSLQFDVDLLKNNDVKIKNSKFKIENIEIDTQGLVASPLDLTIESNEMDLQQLAVYVPAIKPYELKGLAKLQTTFKGSSDVMALKGDLDIKRLVSNYITSDQALLSWDLNQLTSGLSKLSGSATLNYGAGEIVNLKKFVESSSVAKIFLSPLAVLQKLNKAGGKMVSLPSLDHLKYSSIEGNYLFKSGVMAIQKFNLNGDISASAQGTVQLFGLQSVKMTAEIKTSSETLRGTVGQLLKNDSGVPAIKMKITGTMGNPVVSLDVSQVKEKLIDSLKKSNLGSDLMKKFGLTDEVDQLKGIFK
ncbi:MAG: AsmA family protein [Elusimicrobiota bacterium]